MKKKKSKWDKIVPKCLRSPRFPSGDNYKEVVTFLIRHQKIQIRYYKIIFFIGIGGLVASAIGFLILYSYYKNKVFTHKEFYPSAIWSFFVAAFNGLEIEIKKRELYNLIRKKTSGGSWEDAIDLVKSINNFTWEEFKNHHK